MKTRIAALVMSVVLAGSCMTVYGEDMPQTATETVQSNTVQSNTVETITVDTAISTTVDGQYTYSLTSDSDGSVLIRKYKGTDADVTVPAEITGADGNHKVGYIGQSAFRENKTLEHVVISEGIKEIGDYTFKYTSIKTLEIPSSIYYIGLEVFGYANNLEHVTVSESSDYFYDIDGVLYEKDCYAGGVALIVYPPAKEGVTYIVPEGVKMLMEAAFDSPKYLSTIVLSSTLTDAWDIGVYMPDNPITIYVKCPDITAYMTGVFYSLPSGSKIIVKNDIVKEAMTAKLKDCDGTEVLSLTDTTVKNEYASPSSGLTFTDGSKEKNIQIAPKGTYELGTLYQFMLTEGTSFSTDIVTWSSSDRSIATVDAISGQVKGIATGDAVITGMDDNGRTLTVNVTVYKAIESMELELGTYTGESSTIGASAYVSAYDANNAKNVAWSSSDTSVATIESAGYYKYNDKIENYGIITVKKAGSTIITASVNDNGNLIQKQQTFTVTKSIAACSIGTISNQSYTGDKIRPEVVVKDGTIELKEGTDYTLDYQNNTNVGTATVLIIGNGYYTGTAYQGFQIVNTGSNDNKNVDNTDKKVKKSQSISISNKKMSGDVITIASGETLNIGASASTKLTYESTNKKVVEVSASGKIKGITSGITTITVKAAETSVYQSATRKVTVIVVPKQEKVTSFKSLKKGEMTVKWNKDTSATGYEIQYSTSSKFKSVEKITMGSNKSTSKTIKKQLVKGKKYYVRVRAYKTVKIKGKNVRKYGAWSSTKSVTVKNK